MWYRKVLVFSGMCVLESRGRREGLEKDGRGRREPEDSKGRGRGQGRRRGGGGEDRELDAKYISYCGLKEKMKNINLHNKS